MAKWLDVLKQLNVKTWSIRNLFIRRCKRISRRRLKYEHWDFSNHSQSQVQKLIDSAHYISRPLQMYDLRYT